MQWDAGAGVDLDVTRFSRLIRSDTVADLEAAAALYRGEFLAGFGLPECQAFEEWLLLKREELQQATLEGLHTLAAAHLAAGDWRAAERHARRQLALDPWREEAHRQVMRALSGGGQRGAALAQFEACRRLLQEELGVEPDAATIALAATIRGEGAPLQFAAALPGASPTPVAAPRARSTTSPTPRPASSGGRTTSSRCAGAWPGPGW